MYRKDNARQLTFENFYLPFGGKLRSDNRWVVLAKQIPWSAIEAEYAGQFSDHPAGRSARSVRVALGSLIIKERLGVSDRETARQIAENPYLQYFLGFAEYKDQEPFDPSLMTYFRQRFDAKILSRINDLIVKQGLSREQASKEPSSASPENDDQDSDPTPPANGGKLIVDATCAPADVAYPTDLNLLNDGRKKTEAIIDTLHMHRPGRKKPRTYRQTARRDYLAVAKQRKRGYKKIRKAIGGQIRYLRRNLQAIDVMASEGLLARLSPRQYRSLLVIHELYRRQQEMFDHRRHKIEDRIISIAQPHLRPIVRGKAKSPVEFGGKISVSLVEGFSFVDAIHWDNANESQDLIEQIEGYRRRFGRYPESVHADQIYRTRENRSYCRERGIRFSGPPLGRPRTQTVANTDELNRPKQQHRQDEIDRIAIEGKFGQGKRRFGLGRVMAKLAATSEVVIGMAFLVRNLEKILAGIFSFIFFCLRWLARRLVAVQTMTGVLHPLAMLRSRFALKEYCPNQ